MFAKVFKDSAASTKAWTSRRRTTTRGSLGISRKDMPQIASADMPEFITFAKEKGVAVVEGTHPVGKLKPAQSEYNPDQVAQLPVEALRKPLTVSKDSYVLDGTNRWARLKSEDPTQEVKVRRVMLPVKKALELMHSFPKSFRKDVTQVGETAKKAEGFWGRIFKKNIYHDERGRFTSKDKAGGKADVSLADYYAKHDDPNVTSEKILSQFTPAERGEVAMGIIKANATPSSKELYTKKDGSYTEARLKLHREIIQSYLSDENIAKATPEKGTAPTFIILGGRGGSGKSGFTNGKINEFDASKFIVLDSDAIKEKLRPPYKGWNAACVHEESADIFERITEIAMARGLNLVHDSTLRSAKVEKTIKTMQGKGYDIEGHYMFVPRQVSATRAVKRYLGKGPDKRGRLVPVEVVLQNTENEKNFDTLKPYFKKWSAYDNSGTEAKLIGRGKA